MYYKHLKAAAQKKLAGYLVIQEKPKILNIIKGIQDKNSVAYF